MTNMQDTRLQDSKLSSIGKASVATLSPVALIAKRTVDIVAALTFFILFGPLFFAVLIGVKISMGSPAFFWQVRIGMNGQRFRFYKFRSMKLNSESILSDYLQHNDAARKQWDTFQRLENDPRITPLGRMIRLFSLDELPQFWNVLKGDMSLIGPRPAMERQRPLYGDAWEQYILMRPGITGLWQVSGRHNLSFAQRVELDRKYVENWSLWLDLKILLKTASAVIAGDRD